MKEKKEKKLEDAHKEDIAEQPQKISKKPSKPKKPVAKKANKKKYPIRLVAKTYIIYEDDSGNYVWKGIKPGESYKVSEDYEVVG